MNFTLNSQEISLNEQFNGRYNFTVIRNALNLVENNSSTNSKIVFKGDNYNRCNGTSNTLTGSDLFPVGTYYYLIELNNQKNDIVNGWVYLNH